jgi:hypothetical protein
MWADVWTLNAARSTYDPGPPPFKRLTCRILPHGDGVKLIFDAVYPRGGVLHLEWVGRLDGRDYPLQGVDYVLTTAYTPVDDRTYEVIVKVDGAVVATARATMAADGGSMVLAGANVGARPARVSAVLDKRRGAPLSPE